MRGLSEGFPRATCAPTRRRRSRSTWSWSSAAAARRGGRYSKRLESAWQLTLVARRPARPVRRRRRHALQLRHEHSASAEAFSNRHGMVLDTFTFDDPHRTLELNPPEVDRLRADRGARHARASWTCARCCATVPARAAQPQGARPRADLVRRSRQPAATLIEIVAEDRPGLLYDLASAISVERRQYRGGADRHPGAQGHRRLLRDPGGQEALRGSARRPPRNAARGVRFPPEIVAERARTRAGGNSPALLRIMSYRLARDDVARLVDTTSRWG